MSVESLLNARVAVKRHVVTKDSSGGQARGAPAAVSGLDNLAALIQPAPADVRLQWAQRQIFNVQRVYFAREIDLRRGDVLEETSASRQFVVQGWGDAAGQNGRLFYADVTEQTL